MAIDDAMELCQLLEFLDDWLATDHGEVNDSLTRFVGCDGYDGGSLRTDLARFIFLLGGGDGERDPRRVPGVLRAFRRAVHQG